MKCHYRRHGKLQIDRDRIILLGKEKPAKRICQSRNGYVQVGKVGSGQFGWRRRFCILVYKALSGLASITSLTLFPLSLHLAHSHASHTSLFAISQTCQTFISFRAFAIAVSNVTNTFLLDVHKTYTNMPMKSLLGCYLLHEICLDHYIYNQRLP